jgi:hypothetical protein
MTPLRTLVCCFFNAYIWRSQQQSLPVLRLNFLFLYLFHACYIPSSSHPPSFYQSNNTLCRIQNERSEIFMASIVENAVLYDVTQCSLVYDYRQGIPILWPNHGSQNLRPYIVDRDFEGNIASIFILSLRQKPHVHLRHW